MYRLKHKDKTEVILQYSLPINLCVTMENPTLFIRTDVIHSLKLFACTSHQLNHCYRDCALSSHSVSFLTKEVMLLIEILVLLFLVHLNFLCD